MSLDLGEEYRDLVDGGVPLSTDVDEGTLARLKDLFDRGMDFVHAYAALLTVREDNPGSSWDAVVGHTRRMEPGLSGNIDDAAELVIEWVATHEESDGGR
ncbi:MAG: hypothetical protein IJ469_03960 [Candidatus Methanomethylophilaceae archaeon]|nr:hypothetical protein [Candidatus Methanomethylophilaceae archaeon]